MIQVASSGLQISRRKKYTDKLFTAIYVLFYIDNLKIY